MLTLLNIIVVLTLVIAVRALPWADAARAARWVRCVLLSFVRGRTKRDEIPRTSGGVGIVMRSESVYLNGQKFGLSKAMNVEFMPERTTITIQYLVPTAQNTMAIGPHRLVLDAVKKGQKLLVTTSGLDMLSHRFGEMSVVSLKKHSDHRRGTCEATVVLNGYTILESEIEHDSGEYTQKQDKVVPLHN